jgi:ClpX C4-type zinc finger
MLRRRELRCSFCGKGEAEVHKLVAGPRVYICDVCVTAASRIMNDPSGGHRPPAAQSAGRRKLLTRVRGFLRGGGWRRISSPGAPA